MKLKTGEEPEAEKEAETEAEAEAASYPPGDAPHRPEAGSRVLLCSLRKFLICFSVLRNGRKILALDVGKVSGPSLSEWEKSGWHGKDEEKGD